MDYYDASDNKIGRADFNRVDREKWPHLDEKERVENVFEFSVDRAKRLGIEEGMQQGIGQGIEKGIEQGIEQGIEKGIEQGIEQGIEKGKLNTARALLLEGVDERIICKAAQLSKQELAKIKRDLKRN